MATQKDLFSADSEQDPRSSRHGGLLPQNHTTGLPREIKFFFIPAFALVIVLDQLTKYWVRHTLLIEEVRPVIDGFFNLTLRYNYGAAFSMFAGLAPGFREIVLGIGKLIALGVLVYLFKRPEYRTPHARLALGLIFGGAVGNIIDRLCYPGVVDFLDVYIGIDHWPAFNVADSAICVGVAFLLLFNRGRVANISPGVGPKNAQNW